MTALLRGADAAAGQPTAGARARLLFPGLAPFYGRLAPTSYAALRIAYGLTMFTHGLPKLLNEGHGSMVQ